MAEEQQLHCRVMPADSIGWYWEVCDDRDRTIVARGMAESEQEAREQCEVARNTASNKSRAAFRAP
jgi:hypothetical protein